MVSDYSSTDGIRCWMNNKLIHNSGLGCMSFAYNFFGSVIIFLSHPMQIMGWKTFFNPPSPSFSSSIHRAPAASDASVTASPHGPPSNHLNRRSCHRGHAIPSKPGDHQKNSGEAATHPPPLTNPKIVGVRWRPRRLFLHLWSAFFFIAIVYNSLVLSADAFIAMMI